MTSKKPRVLMLSQDVHSIPPVKGAAVEHWIDQVAQRLKNYEPTILSIAHPSLPLEEERHGVFYKRIRVSRLYTRLFRKITRLDPWPYIQRVIHEARRIDPQVIHLHNAPYFVKEIRQAFPDKVLILHMHNEKKVAQDLPIDCLAACSDYVRDFFRDQGLHTPCFATIPNGVDIQSYQPVWTNEDERSRVRRSLGLDERKVILYVGRISEEKGPDRIVEAFSHLDPTRFQLVLIGEWRQGDPEKDRRAAYAKKLEIALQEIPHKTLGVINPKEMPKVYPIGDLLVIPSRFEEPFSMAAIEAMATGVPVLALRRGGMTEYMIDGENAALLPADVDSVLMAQTIEDLMDRPDHLNQLAHNARTMVEQRFSWKHVANETERLFDDLCIRRSQ
jgi:glycosyltransferase involved in cell wall biosynthesis